MAVDPGSGTIYVGTLGGGVFKSTDDGVTFTAKNSGLGLLAISAMVMDPSNPDNVTVGTAGRGIFRTVDGGQHWNATSEVAGIVVFLAIDPHNSQILYAGYQGGSTLKKSIDGGRTWVSANAGIPTTSVWSIICDPAHDGVVYAAGAGAGAFKSFDGGASWSSMLIQPVVWSLALDPADSRVIYAGVNGDGVFKSTDGGGSFSRIGSPEVGVVLSLGVDPVESRRIYAATVSGGVEVSSDGGATWKKTNIRSGIAITLTVTERGDVYVGTGFNGVFSAYNPGAGGELSDLPDEAQGGCEERFSERRFPRFRPIASAALTRINAQSIVSVVIDPRNAQHLTLGTNDGGLIGSLDGGENWIAVNKGFLNRSSRGAVFDTKIAGRVYAGSFTGGGLYRSDDNGFSWSRHAVGSPASYVWSSGIDPFSGAVYAGTKNKEGLWKSTDEGITFTRIDGTQIPQALDIVFDASTRGKLFVAALNGLFRSLDGGATFSKIATDACNTVSIDPSNPNVIYAGTQASGVLKSIDGGTTFVPSNTGLVVTFPMNRGNGVAVDPTNPSILYVGSEGAGVFKSRDAGATWFPTNEGLTNLSVFGLALDPTHPNILYVGGSSGVFKTITGGQ